MMKTISRCEQRGQRDRQPADRIAEIGGAQGRREILRGQAKRAERDNDRCRRRRHARKRLHDDHHLLDRFPSEADDGHQAVAERGVGLEELFGALLNDGVQHVERAADAEHEQSLVDEEGRKGDVAGNRRADQGREKHPCQRARRTPRIPRLLGRIYHPAHGDRARNADQQSASRARGDRDIERGGPFRDRLEKLLRRPEEGRRHQKAKQHARSAIAEREQAPVRFARRQEPFSEGVGERDQTKPVQHGVDARLHARIGDVENVERVGDCAKRAQRQGDENGGRPARRDRPFQPRGRFRP